MKYIKIQIPDPGECATALVEMSKRGRIDCYRDNVYMVPEPALEFLTGLGITFKELDRGGLDYALKTLRDAQDAASRRNSA
jgi:hypothetical protein